MTVHVERFFMMPWAELLEERGNKLRHATEPEGRKCRRNNEGKLSTETTEVCPLDLYENDNGLLIRADLPGFTKEQIAISLDGEGRLQIKATRAKPQEEQEGEWRSVLRERSISEEVGRTVMLPRDAQPDRAQASYQEGVLEVRIPKEQPQKKQILIN